MIKVTILLQWNPYVIINTYNKCLKLKKGVSESDRENGFAREK